MVADTPAELLAETFATVWPSRDGMRERAETHLPALVAALSALYGGSEDFSGWATDLLHSMAQACAERPDELWALDSAREADPSWFLAPAMLGYTAYVDRFGTDLAGIARRTPYLRDLGVTYLHLLPFWRARDGDNDGGFAVADYGSVQPGLGTIADVGRLAATLRRSGISLCADLVLNHTADDHPWALAAKAGDPAYRAYYHVLPDEAAVAAWETHLGQVFPRTAPGNFTYVDAMGGWIWTTFYPYQWDLNYANPAVFAEVAGIMMDLANRGVEAFRLDSAAFLWKRLGTGCRSQPETHLVLRALRALMAIVAPAVLLKSEVIAPVADAAQYLGSDIAPECHLAYHAGLMTASWAALAEQDVSTLREVIDAAPALPRHAGWVIYVRCHDDIGWQPLAPQATRAGALDAAQTQARLKAVSDFYTEPHPGRFASAEAFQAGADGAAHGLNGTAASLAGLETALTEAETELAVRRLLLLYGLAFSAGGMPLINMGDELGQLNDWSYRDDPDRAHEGRWLHRPRFDEAAALRGSALRMGFARLIEARRKLPALSPETRPGSMESGYADVLAFSRGPVVRVLANFSASPREMRLDGAWNDLLSSTVEAQTLQLAAYGMAWLTKPETSTPS